MEIVKLIKETRSGVVQILIERDKKLIGSGSGFLVEGGFVTNSHNIRSHEIDVIAIRFDDTNPNDSSNFIRIAPDDCVAAESSKDEKDFVYLKMSEPEFNGRHVFQFLESNDSIMVGESSVFLGFPFGMTQLTSHMGFISSIHNRNGIKVLQIDGSVNGGNSGGPLVDIKTGKVAGIITRAVTGLIEEQFKYLLDALQQNRKMLNNAKSLMSIGGIDPIEGIKASQAAMEQIAKGLLRSANVGIGYAYSAEYVRDAIVKCA